MEKAVCLISGGLDSAVAAALAKDEGRQIVGLTVSYGQIHSREIESARRVGDWVGADPHHFLSVDLTQWGGSSLLQGAREPEAQRQEAAGAESEIPGTYVPARNTVLLALALSAAEAHGAFEIYIGANQLDYSGYPDCRAKFLSAFESMANLATKAAITGAGRFRVKAPLLRLTKAEIITLGARLGLDFSITWSCYAGGETPCGRCDSCRFRAQGFSQAGIPDPLASTL